MVITTNLCREKVRYLTPIINNESSVRGIHEKLKEIGDYDTSTSLLVMASYMIEYNIPWEKDIINLTSSTATQIYQLRPWQVDSTNWIQAEGEIANRMYNWWENETEENLFKREVLKAKDLCERI